MICEKCNRHTATVLYKETVNGVTSAWNLCPACATSMNAGGFLSGTPFPLFDGLFGLGKPVGSVPPAKSCEGCGATLADIQREGKACCPQCYATFAEAWEGTVRSIHGKAVHTGRTPSGFREKKEAAEQLALLKKQLSEAIAAEKYEDAARIRDEIRALEKGGN